MFYKLSLKFFGWPPCLDLDSHLYRALTLYKCGVQGLRNPPKGLVPPYKPGKSREVAAIYPRLRTH